MNWPRIQQIEQMSNPPAAIQIKGFSYAYRDPWRFTKNVAIKQMSLTVFEGESFGFLGASGAGKTTTIKSILGLTKPTTGTIELFGKSSLDPQARASIGYVPERPYFYDHLTANELVTFYAVLAGVSRHTVRSAVKTALERVGILHKQHSPMRSLSKGQTQRVAMAQAIVSEPRLLMLDEPFSGLDPIGRREFKDLLFELRKKGVTIFISSHILEDIEFLCDRASILAHGELQAILNLSDLEEHVERKYVLTLQQPVATTLQIEELPCTIDRQGSSLRLIFRERREAEKAAIRLFEQPGAVSEYRAAHGNLEDLFIQLVTNKTTPSHG